MRGHIVKRYEDSYSIVLNLGTDPATGKRKQQWLTVKGKEKKLKRNLLNYFTSLIQALSPSQVKLRLLITWNNG